MGISFSSFLFKFINPPFSLYSHLHSSQNIAHGSQLFYPLQIRASSETTFFIINDFVVAKLSFAANSSYFV